MNKKLITGLIIAITVILGAVAVYTAWRISRLSTTAPEKSRAATTTESCEITSFTISRVSPSPSPTPTGSPTVSPSPSPTSSPTETPTPTNSPSPTNTPSPTNSPTPIATSTPNPTDRVSIPSTDSGIPAPGTPLPTLVLGLFGVILIVIGIQITTLLGRR